MKHRIGYNRIGRKAAHRKALVKNMVMQLYRYERIRTTKAKALEVRRRAEKLITRAKEDSVQNRRIAAKFIHEKEILAKLFTEIAPGYVDRPGGYTRILKLGYRKGDAAEMVLLELVGREEKTTARRRRARAEESEETAEPSTAEPVMEEESEEIADEPEDSDQTTEADTEMVESEESGAASEEEQDTESDD